RPAKGYERAPSRQSWQQNGEKPRIFPREQPRKQALFPIVDDQTCLNTLKFWLPPEPRHHRPQLPRIGSILGVIDHHKLAATEGQREIERLRFGPRHRIRIDHTREPPIRRMTP